MACASSDGVSMPHGSCMIQREMRSVVGVEGASIIRNRDLEIDRSVVCDVGGLGHDLRDGAWHVIGVMV